MLPGRAGPLLMHPQPSPRLGRTFARFDAGDRLLGRRADDLTGTTVLDVRD